MMHEAVYSLFRDGEYVIVTYRMSRGITQFVKPRYPHCRWWTLTEEHKDAWQAVQTPLPSDCRQAPYMYVIADSKNTSQ